MALAVLMLTLVSIGAVAQVKVVFGEKGEEKFPGTGGTITVSQDTKGDEVTVTLTVTPDKGYTITKGDIKVYATYPPSGTRTPEIADDLTLYFNGSEKEDVKDPSEKRDYTFTISSNFGAWVKEAKFQSSGKKGGDEPTREDYSGTYFIKSESDQKNTSGDYYMCPTKNWYLYKATNSYEDDTDNDDDNGKPFLTTYQCKNNANYTESKAVWTIIKHSEKENCYYIIQSRTGRYLVSNKKITDVGINRMRVHLESVADDTALSALGDLALFEITPHDGHIDIVPHSSEGRNTDTYKYLVVNFKNFNELIGSAGKNDGPNGTYGKNVAGIIGLYDTENNHKWSLEQASRVTPAPAITNPFDGTITITGTGTIYYTTDGTDPTTSSSTYSSAITLTDDVTVIKAMAKDDDSYESMVVTCELPKCERPVISVSNGTVTISTTTEGASIRYTTNDTEPTSSSTLYTASFPIGDISTIRAIAVKVGYAKSEEAYYEDFRTVSSSSEITNMQGLYRLASGFTSTSAIGTASAPFTGTIDGQMNTISGLNHSLVAYANGAIIKNVILDNVSISGNENGNAGAICGEATGDTRIYNCGVLATGSTVNTDKDGYTYLTNCSSSVSGSNYVGGIVGLLDGSARVINCFSYANVSGGNYAGGIVGYNKVATKSDNLKTMVMNCMFYGEVSGSSQAPIYNGSIITNRGDQSGVSNFNYFWAGASYVQNSEIDVYNCALSAETRFLQRFEFFRHMLNSNRELAAWWATGSMENKEEIMKWVLEPSQIGSSTPYPILKTPGQYPSVVNIDADHAEVFSVDAATKKTQYNQGRKFGTLTINIQNASSGSGNTAPSGANITTTSVTPNITDKDPAHFNFNYYKVQLPYYNDVGTKNYTGNKVVTGWKIVAISDGAHSFSTGEDATATTDKEGNITLITPYNFADRKSTEKDLFSTSGRVFSQGAYFDVPEGVSSITIEPYWGKCVYVSDEYPDVVYDQNMSTASSVTTVGGGQRYTNGESCDINGNSQAVYTTMAGAVTALNPSGSVYDNAIVLVGNVHSLSLSNETKSKPYTIMSIDLDKDNEPDYSYILRFDSRKRVHPVRVDFLNVIGLGMAQKSNGGTGTYNFGIMQPYGWFECTNTGLFRVTQLEYDLYDSNSSTSAREESPMILQGGVIEQWVTVGGSEVQYQEAKSVTYYHVGGNVWFKEFHIGVHQDKTQNQFVSKHPPISVTGGDYDIFYLTGYYNSPNNNYDDNAECYINGGRFNKVAGTGMQGIGNLDTHANGNITWQIDNADINEFYGGGINAAHIAEGNIMTVLSNSRVDQFCGGPKFGDMNSGRKVVTNATNCTFRTFFGAGYGGNSYNRKYPANKNNVQNINWNSWIGEQYTKKYDVNYGGVETRIDYQFIPMSSNTSNVARLFVDYVSFSLATTRDVTSKLTDCTITKNALGSLDLFSQSVGNFYGGGNLGMVDGPVKSTLTNCTVEGSVFGAGYSASMPPVAVMDNSFQTSPKYDSNLGAYLEAVMPSTETYTWQHRDVVYSTETAIDKTNHILYTTANLTTLGAVTGTATLTINGTTTVAGSVYGGGEESNVSGNTQVNINGGTITQNVFGGGKGKANNFQCDKAMVGVSGDGSDTTPGGTNVTITGGTVMQNVYGGGEVGRVEKNTIVTIGVENEAENATKSPVINGSVFGAGQGKETHGYSALVRGNSTVTIQGNAKVAQNVYGGGEMATAGRYWVKGIVEDPNDPAPESVPEEMPYKTKQDGVCTVSILGYPQIGPDGAASETEGHVFGAGKGVTPHYVHTGERINWSRRMVDYAPNREKNPHTQDNKGIFWDPYDDPDDPNDDPDHPTYVWEYFTTEDKYLEFLQTLALVTGTDVTIGGGTVKGNVYGGSQSGFVQDNTDVKVTGGSIGTEGTTMYGNVFGGGKGLEEFAEAGKVKGNTGITISGGTTNGNVYGGGELGDVGTIDKTDINNYTWSGYGDEDTTNDTGKCLVSVTNAAAEIKGDVFGAGKGSGVTFQCEKAMAYNTEVTISAGTLNRNVYGGGEVGRVENNTKVKIGDGAGVAEGEPTSAPNITLSVFGAGKGLATHGYSALVRGNTEVTVEGNAKVGKSVYGGGEIASVGRYGLNADKMPNILLDGGECKVNVQGYAVIGPENASDDKGNVFGAGKGVDTPFDGTNKRMTLDDDNHSVYQDIGSEEAYKSYLETLALATKPIVTIGGNTTINGSVYGGGELGLTKGSVIVTINGGTVEKDVYGGGALANTNTTHEVGVKENGVWKKENGEYVTTTVHPTTKVNLLGGLIKRDAFGGGLGQLGESPIAAIVDGDVTVELNNNNGTCQVNGSVFGSNNINGTPKGHVLVHVFKTFKAGNAKDPEKTTFSQRWSENATYDLAAVYGGGNKADYKPTSVTDYAEVIIDGCEETSIKEVYGGGYGAAVPATQVKILGAYLINEVFGGGYGAGDNNDGANVGYYTYKNEEDKTVYTGFTDNDGNGKAQVKLYGGKVYTAYGGSNTKGNIRGGSSAGKATDIQVTCSLEVKNIYGAGKNADQDGGTDLVIGCIPGLENVYGGAKDANIKGGVNLVITGGDFVNVFGGNDTSGTIQGPIKVYIEEDCDEINIMNLYLGGNQAPYSVYGYYDDNGTLKPRTSATDTNPVADGTIAPDATTHQYEDPQLYVTKFTSIENVYGGGYGSGAVMYGNPTVNINEVKKKFADGIGEIENVYGGGDAAKVEGSTTVNVGTIDYAFLKYITVGETDVTGYYTRSGEGTTEEPYVYTVVAPEAPATEVTAQADTDYYMPVLGANITGNVFGGGNLADVTGNTFVNICAKKDGNDYVAVAEGAEGVTIGGNVFGGGKGKADTFTCEKAMIGGDGKGLNANYTDGNTSVVIGNGTIGTLEGGELKEGTGNVYGGGQIGRVERNTTVTIGLGDGIATGTPESTPEIRGKVFGAGAGEEEHGYAALVRGNPTVTIQGNAKIGQSVYGGGEIASVARYKVAETPEEAAAHGVDVDMPYVLENNEYGHCVVTIRGYAEIGPDNMKMYHENVDVGKDKPDDYGHVFGAGKGVLPKVYTSYGKSSNGPKRMILYNNKVHTNSNANWEWVDPNDTENNKNIWEYFASEEKYFEFIHTLALATETEVTIDGDAFVKGSVYGGSENGLVQFDTKVYIKDGQIGNGDGVNRRYSESDWSSESLAECAHWDYGLDTNSDGEKDLFAPYDPNANATGNLDKYPKVDAQSEAKSTEGGRRVATDGHTFYGNVFGGGSGSVPYFDTQKGISRYIPTAGEVKGNTHVTISGGHILTNVYGGNEATNVLGTVNVTMTGGSIGVPRTPQQIKDHPVTCYLFGAGKGDQRIFFNKETNVNDAIVKVEGGTIYGSVFGGGEDGHVLRNTSVTIGKTDGTGPKIGTVGSTYVDGNVFGGGRGFGGEALTAGNVGGAVDLIINGGEMFGSIYGGGRLASVGYGLYLTTEDGYGVMRKDDEYDGSYPNPSSEAAGTFYTKGRGHIKVTVNGGTIGKEFADDTEGEHSGNVFGGSMGRLTKLDGTPFDAADHWKLLATAKSATVNINGGTIKRSVYGGGEMGTVTENTNVTVSGGSIGTSGKGGAEFGNVYGGGKGLTTEVLAGIVKGNTKVTISSDSESPNIYHNIYGGGAYGSVGAFDLSTEANKASYHVPYAGMPVNWTDNTGKCEVNITGGVIGTDGHENGMVFGSSRGDVATPDNGVDPNDLLAWVHDTHVTIGTQSSDEGPQINGSVYGSGENGHVFNNTQVDIHSGTVGILSGTPVGTYTEGGATYPFRGNVYGGGCGTDTYSVGTGDEKKEYFNPLAGIVFGNTKVTMDGGRVVRTVYGGGAMGSVGTFTNDDNGKPATCAEGTGLCTVSISGGKIGPATMAMPNNYGNVFGAGRGEVHDLAVYPNLEKMAYFNNTEVTISGSALVKGSVYGGSESGHVLNDTWVKIAGGQVGCGKDLDVAYSNWDQTSMEECPHWPYNEDGAAYDKYANEYDSKGGSTAATDGHTFYGNVFGGGSGYEPYAPGKWVPTAGLVEGNTTVDITGGHILTSVYGGNEQTDVNGSCTVTMSGGTVGVPRTHAERQAHPVTGNLFGAGKGDKRILFNTWTNVGSTVIDISGGRVYGSVFGGGEDGHVLGDAKTTIRGAAEIGTLGTTGNDGNVFGGGRGSVSARTAGVVSGSVTLDIQDGLIMGSVYGGGRLASVGTYLVPTNDSRYGKQIRDGKNQIIGSADDVNAPGVTHGHVDITIAGGTIGALDADGKVKESANSIGDVYGGCKGTTEGEFHDKLGVSKNATVNLLGGTVGNSIYGGGEVGNVGELGEDDLSSAAFAKVNLLGGSVKNVYGGGLGKKTSSIDAKALVKGDVTVNLNGLEKDDYDALVLPNNINKDAIFDEGHTEDNYVFYRAKSRANGCKVLGNIFGCNNVNGSPTGHAKVHVFMTTPKTGQLETEYDISAIYGGGNQADYEPTDTKQSTEVIIEGCDLTKIQQVYGGGNAAASPGTSVLIKGTELIDEVFGGGNGVSTETFENPGANVGYHTDKTPYTSGDGKANVQLMAGNVHNAYGGSNSNGDIRGGSSITKPTPVWSEGVTSCCKDLAVDQIFGGGKNADMRSGAEIVMGCMPDDWIGEIYAGAEMANVKGDVSLTLTSGKFGRVFGGNKTSGILDGSITVNIDENGACDVPIVIGELYGGGNMAAYSIFGYEGDAPRTKAQYDALTMEQKAALDLEEPHASPVVNVHGFTSIGNIFGGGFGADAKMYGNPTVNINEVMVERNKAYQFANDQSANKPTELIDGENVKLLDHMVGNMGVINNVFGGGNAALVDGNTNVNIATEKEVYVVKLVDVGNSVTGLYKRVKNEMTGVISYELQGATDKAVEGSNYYQKQTVVGADIRGNVYGGGNEAEVTGNTNVVIGKRSE